MSNCINDMVWEQIWEQINLDEFTLDEKHLDRVSNLAIEHGLHEDDDREKNQFGLNFFMKFIVF